MKRDDAGFTLPEVLVAIVTTAIVMPVLVQVFITGVRTTTGTTERLSASNDASMTSSWFVPDVQSADTFLAADDPSCASPGTRLFTAKRAAGADSVITGYATVGDGSAARTMVRYACTNGVADPTVTLGHSLAATVGPLVTCTPSPCGPTTTHISVTVTDTTGYEFTLNAKRRVS